MINYFLETQPEIQPKIKKIIKSILPKRRKYQPFHLDCQSTRQKICYCVKNTVINVEI